MSLTCNVCKTFTKYTIYIYILKQMWPIGFSIKWWVTAGYDNILCEGEEEGKEKNLTHTNVIIRPWLRHWPNNVWYFLCYRDDEDDDIHAYPVVREHAGRLLDTGINTLQKTLLLKKEVCDAAYNYKMFRYFVNNLVIGKKGAETSEKFALIVIISKPY